MQNARVCLPRMICQKLCSCPPMTDKLSGITLRLKKKKDLDSNIDDEALKPDFLSSIRDQVTSFSADRLRNWLDVENHARTLAPIMGIHPEKFENAKNAVGAQKVSCAVVIMLPLGKCIRDFGAYFHSITLGQKQNQFDPLSLIKRLSKTNKPTI